MTEVPALAARLALGWDLGSRCNVDLRGLIFRLIMADEHTTPKLALLLASSCQWEEQW